MCVWWNTSMTKEKLCQVHLEFWMTVETCVSRPSHRLPTNFVPTIIISNSNCGCWYRYSVRSDKRLTHFDLRSSFQWPRYRTTSSYSTLRVILTCFLFQCYIHVSPRTCACVNETVSQNAPPWLHWSWVKEWKKGPKRYAARVRRKRPGMALGDDPIRLNTASRRRQQTNQGHKSTLLQSPPLSSSLSRAEISTVEAVYTAPNCIFYPGK